MERCNNAAEYIGQVELEAIKISRLMDRYNLYSQHSREEVVRVNLPDETELRKATRYFGGRLSEIHNLLDHPIVGQILR